LADYLAPLIGQSIISAPLLTITDACENFHQGAVQKSTEGCLTVTCPRVGALMRDSCLLTMIRQPFLHQSTSSSEDDRWSFLPAVHLGSRPPIVTAQTFNQSINQLFLPQKHQ